MRRGSLCGSRATLSLNGLGGLGFRPLGCEVLEQRTLLSVTQLMRDINQVPNPTSTDNSSSPGSLAVVSGLAYFVAGDAQHGRELWRSDGTASGTALVKDIYPGLRDSYISQPVAHQGLVYFTANDGIHGTELWRSDGTAAGTILVRDLQPGTQSSFPGQLTSVGGKLFFTAATDLGNQLYVSDGTEAGTVSITPSNQILQLTDISGTLFFGVSKGAGFELWKSDGTAAGTTLVNTITQYGFYVSATAMVEFQGLAYFFATGTSYGNYTGKLWRSDGTAAGTLPVADIAGYELFAGGDRLYFSGQDTTHGIELWTSDGTTAGTFLLKDILPGTASSHPRKFVDLGGEVYFVAKANHYLDQLWKTDGTEAGTTIVSEARVIVQANDFRGNDDPLAVVGSQLYFASYNEEYDLSLWKSDGTVAGTMPVREFSQDMYMGYNAVTHLTEFGGQLLFAAPDAQRGVELWMSDGTLAGSSIVKDINPVPSANQGSRLLFNQDTLVASGDIVFLSADDGVHGEELWRTDATEQGTKLVRDLMPGAASSKIRYLTAIPGGVAFVADDEAGARDLWRSDGTAAGTFKLTEFDDAQFREGPENLTFVDGRLFFGLDSLSGGTSLWVSDGTTAGTQELASFLNPAWNSTPRDFTLLGDRVYFTAVDPTYGNEIWSTDGTPAGTTLAVDVTPGPAGGVGYLTRVGNEIFFYCDSSDLNSRGLWKTDGTSAGTTPIVAIPYGIGGRMVASDQLLYYEAGDPVTDSWYVWRTDGTAAGTFKLKNTVHEPSLGVVNGMLFVEDTGILWRSDGTVSGTITLREFGSIDDDYNGGQFQEFDGQVYFKGDDGIHGEELWRTDGTPEGTELVTDLRPGRMSSVPAGILTFNGKLLMRADDGVHGAELYTLDPRPAEVVARHVFYNNSAFDGGDPLFNRADDEAIAPDKSALLPGQTASSANYTSYSRGLNGIVIDLARASGSISRDDFEFRVGNDDTPGDWASAPEPSMIVVRPGEGASGYDRIEIIWDDGAIRKEWLQVTVKATANTQLAEADVFYFGNAIGDTLNAPANAIVNSSDEIAIRNNPATFLNPAAMDSPYDINRDGLVNATDQILARSGGTTMNTALRLIQAPPLPLAALASAATGGSTDSSLATWGITCQRAQAADKAIVALQERSLPDLPVIQDRRWPRTTMSGIAQLGKLPLRNSVFADLTADWSGTNLEILDSLGRS